jgi:hypothetical protein
LLLDVPVHVYDFCRLQKVLFFGLICLFLYGKFPLFDAF